MISVKKVEEVQNHNKIYSKSDDCATFYILIYKFNRKKYFVKLNFEI